MIGRKSPVFLKRTGAGVFVGAVLVWSISQASANDHPAPWSHNGHEGMSMAMDEQMQMDDTDPAKLLADKKESEFNHHFAGFCVILAGLFILAEGTLRQRRPLLRFAWPFCFLLSGLFLLVFSDTELWPFGPQSWSYGLTHNLEDLQRKTFAVTLLALGFLELQRDRGVLKSASAGWVFPVLADCGSVMLRFHEHHTGMHGAEHMTVMARVQTENLNFALPGFGIGVLKGLSELPTRLHVTLAWLWSLPMIALGVMLMLYVE